LKSLIVHPKFCNDIDRDAIALLMRHNYIPAPYSIFKGIYKLIPGNILRLCSRDLASVIEMNPYWSFKQAAEYGAANPFTGSPEDAAACLDTLLKQAVRQQMIADVPLGAFLSGGIDSSTVVALMQQQSQRPVKTFTIGFNEQAYNEAVWAKEVASRLGTNHTELYVTPEEAMAVIPRLPELYDEPFADSSQIPTYLVSQLTRKSVTVSLSGDGGDELFGGYNRYLLGRSLWRKIGWIPRPAKSAAAAVLTSVSPQAWEKLFTNLGGSIPDRLKLRHPGDKLHKLAEVLNVSDAETLYLRLISHWKNPSSLVLGSREPETAVTMCGDPVNLPDFTHRMMYLDTLTYLPDDILVKVDRASMGVGLEARVPLLDHRVVEFAWSLPLSMKIRNGQGKWLLRQVLYRYIPKELVERPKTGFGIPLDGWLRGSLRDWAESLLNEQRLRKEGFFNQDLIREKWQEHLDGRRNWQYYLWDVLMFEAWLDNHNKVMRRH
jgi:asparagine synthase (glutamine-hydrolysing)